MAEKVPYCGTSLTKDIPAVMNCFSEVTTVRMVEIELASFAEIRALSRFGIAIAAIIAIIAMTIINSISVNPNFFMVLPFDTVSNNQFFIGYCSVGDDMLGIVPSVVKWINPLGSMSMFFKLFPDNI